MRKSRILFAPAFFLSACLFAAPPELVLKLDDVIQKNLSVSPELASYEENYQAVLSQARSESALLLPKLSFDARYQHVKEIPLFSPIPGGPKTQFGDHKNYSYGPAISWLIWDTGGHYMQWKSLSASAESKFYELDAEKRQHVLAMRLNYFQLMSQLEQLRAISESLLLANEQYTDINAQFKAGAVSRIDPLSSHQEFLNRKRDLRQVQTEVAGSLREIFAETGLGEGLDPSVPFYAAVEGKLASLIDQPTLIVKTDIGLDIFGNLKEAQSNSFDEHHPQLLSLTSAAEAAERLVKASESQHGPSVFASASFTRDYPNGPVLETINQQTIGVAATWSLFEFKRVVNQTKSQKSQQTSIEKSREQLLLNLKRDWAKAQDKLKGLFVERDLAQNALSESQQLTKLVYDSYKAGRSNFIDVENANYRSLLTDVENAQIQTQILIQLAILDSLSEQAH